MAAAVRYRDGPESCNSYPEDAGGNGMISFTFDDGNASVRSAAEPILRRYGMVATVGAICNPVFWNNTQAFMGPDDLHYLAQAGWEIASHSLFHRRLALLPPSYEDESASWQYDSTTGVWSAACPWGDVGTVACGGRYLKRATSAEHFKAMVAGFLIEPEKTVIHVKTTDKKLVPDSLRLGSAEREIVESRDVFRQNGFDTGVFVVPFSGWSPRLQAIGTKYYSLIACGGAAFNTRETISRKLVSRFGTGRDVSTEDVIARLEDHLSHNSWGIVLLHDLVSEMRGKWKWTISQFESVVKWVSDKNVPVYTLSEGARRMVA
ncbi:MAG: polysaccharide deacetylase family protein [Stellaceae bacterium]